ncbi:MAG TPA: CPBP family intramembrane metalloprotease [Gemmatimonadetes bacterium]|nr:CPBP family intramembrane metalloprotease [Gemmatimonadota bacterium]
MTRRPTFWIIFCALGIAGAVTAIRLFSVAMPSISLDISMDRGSALAEAAALAERYGWAPSDARSAASFGQVGSEVQTYVELEGGGSDAFANLANLGVYQPYQWAVRRFAEGEVAEALVRFTPEGSPYGFRLRLSEDDPGQENLDQAAARAAAEAGAAEWTVDLSSYSLLESSAETLPGGRVDHTFVFERTDTALAQARFRVRLVIAGDQFAQLTHFVHVPEAFSRQYADMRSTNEAIALVAQSIFILVFVLFGAGLGTALLLRRRWVEWRTALMWGGFSALLIGLNGVNALPLSWMSYDTALSANTFVLQQIAAAGAIFVLGTPVLGFFFMAGESLGRRAFPGHLQQWRAWSPEVASSNSVLGLTTAAYVLLGLGMGYLVLFYLGTSRLDGWWSPAGALVQPDLLATYMPWLQAVSISLYAAMWEESVFRAVPIACAALIGLKYGRKSLWIWGMVVLQAVVFAAGHANYPQQPPYARVIELTIPALIWGAVYVRFGLLPTILTHFLYDLTLISSVLFASDAMFDQGVIVAVGLIPLALVLWARRGGRARSTPPEWAYNRGWTPPELPGGTESEGGALPGDGSGPERGSGSKIDPAPEGDSEPEGDRQALLPVPTRVIYVGGLTGLLLWVTGAMVREPPPTLVLGRSEIAGIAQQAMDAFGGASAGWTRTLYTGGGNSRAHTYVLEQGGEEALDQLFGSYLTDPQWVVRYADWGAEPEQRIEEFRLYISRDGGLRRIAHILPEARAGAGLSEDSARVLALAAAGTVMEEDAVRRLEEVGAEEIAQPARTDWEFTFRDPAMLAGLEGEARLTVDVAGGGVSDVRRYVHVPEEWDRERRESDNRRSIVLVGLGMVLVLTFGGGAIIAIVVWSRRGLPTRVVLTTAGATFLALTLSIGNGWPDVTANFTTAQPWPFQAGAAVFAFLLLALVGGAGIGLVSGLGHRGFEPRSRKEAPLWTGVALGLLIAGLRSTVFVLAPGWPPLPDYSGASAFLPVLAEPLAAVTPFLLFTAAVLALSAAFVRFTGHPVYGSMVNFTILATGAVIVPSGFQTSVLAWIGTALIGVAVVLTIVRFSARVPALAPLIVGTLMVTVALETALTGPYLGARVGGLLAASLIAWLALIWSRALGRSDAPGAGAQPAQAVGL